MKFEAKLGVSQWVQLPDYVRRRIVELFNVPRSDGAYVQDGKLKTDGHNEKDLQHISVDKMQALTKSSSDNYFELFDLVLEYVENEHSNKLKDEITKREQRAEQLKRVAAQTAMDTIAAISEATAPILKKRGRPKKVTV